MSKLALTWAAIKGALNPFGSIFDSVATYVLGKINDALNAIDVGKRTKIQAALNIAQKAFAVLQAVRFLCPTKWQTAYTATLDVVNDTVNALFDLHLTIEELSAVRTKFEAAYKAWQSPDDETCVDESALKAA